LEILRSKLGKKRQGGKGPREGAEGGRGVKSGMRGRLSGAKGGNCDKCVRKIAAPLKKKTAG